VKKSRLGGGRTGRKGNAEKKKEKKKENKERRKNKAGSCASPAGAWGLGFWPWDFFFFILEMVLARTNPKTGGDDRRIYSALPGVALDRCVCCCTSQRFLKNTGGIFSASG